MDYFDIGDTISRADLNSIVYLLRKFKRLTKELTIGPSQVKTEYGTFNFTDGFKSTGNNWILEEDVTITSDNVLTNTFYTFIFNVIDVNMSGTVNTRTVSVTSATTGDAGVLEVVVGEDILGENEVLLPGYTLSITFDEHEYYTPLSNYDVELTVEKERILLYEDNTIYLTLTNDDEPVAYALTSIVIDGEEFFNTTNDEGVAEFTYTGKGAGTVTVTTPLDSTVSVSFVDNPDYVSATFTGSTVTLGSGGGTWVISNGPVIVDWGDGTTTKVNNPTTSLSHTYTDNESSHDVLFVGEVTGLGNNCFKNCSNLQSISILPEINSLGSSCFNGCSSLTSIVLPTGITELKNDCFRSCSGLTSITIPDSVTTIGNNCFRYCSNLETVNFSKNLTSIGTYCFDVCSSLTGVTLPESLTVLKDSCFRNCAGITSITIPLGVTKIESNCFRNCGGLTGIVIPNTITEIGDYCFYGCNHMTSAVLSDNLTALPSYSFYNCSSLTSISIPSNVMSIGAYCFRGCTSLTSVTIPSNVTNLGESCFNNCTGLTTFTLPDSIEMIGTGCFGSCTALIDYQLYWVNGDIPNASDAHLVNNTNTKFTIPNGTYDDYVNKGFPPAKLIERGYRLAVSTNKTNITTNDTATVTATLYNDGVVSSSKTLDYSVKHGNTVLSSGTKTTNNNGQATITYTGTSIGEVEITIGYSNLAQKTIYIYDSIKYDNATTSSHNDIWTLGSNENAQLTRKSSYSTLSEITPDTSNDAIISVKIDHSCILEFDIQLVSEDYGQPFGQYGQSANAYTRRQINLPSSIQNGEWHHIRLELNDGRAVLTSPELSNPQTFTLSNYDSTMDMYWRFRTVSDIAEINFKNFVYYPYNLGKSLSIKANKSTMYTDETVTISGVLLNDGLPVNQGTVTVYRGSTSLGNVTTNSNGEYSKTVNGLSAGQYTFKATHDTIETSTVNLTVNNHTYALSVARNKSTIYTDESVTISGVLTKDGVAYSGQTVTIYDGSTSKGTATTNTNGAYTKTLTGLTAGNHNIQAQHTNATSTTVSVTVNNHSYSLTASASKSPIYTDESTVISGILKKDNVVWSNQEVTIYDGSTSLGKVKTGSDGKYTKTVTGLSAGNHTLKAQHANATSSNVSVTVNNHTYSLTASLGASWIYTDGSTQITGTLKKDGNVYANQEVTIYKGSTSLGTVSTNNNGVYTKTLQGLSAGTYTLKASYAGTNSSTVTLTVKNHTYTVSATVSPTSIYSNQSTTVQGTLTKDGNVYANQVVTIYDGSSQIATAKTDSSGHYVKELSGLSVGEHSIRAGYSGVYSGSTVVSVTDSYVLTVTTDKSNYMAGERTFIEGLLTKNGNRVDNVTIRIYDGNTLVGSYTTWSGMYYLRATFEHGSHTIRAVCSYAEASTTFTVTDYDVSLSVSSASIYSDESVTVSGTLLRGGIGYSGQTVTIYDGSNVLTTVTTGTGGAFSKTIDSLSVGSHTLKAGYSGVYSSTSSVTVNPAYTLTASVSPTTLYTDGSVTVAGTLTYHGSGYAGKTINIYDGNSSVTTVSTGNDGSYTKSVGGFTAGSHTVKTSYGNYITSSATNITVNSHTYSLTATTSKDAYYTDETPVLTGVLKRDGSNWSGQSVEIYVDGSYEDTVTTGSDGGYSFNVDMLVSTGQHTLQAKHTNVNSTVKTITVNNHSYSLTAGASPTSITYGQSTTVSGVLTKDSVGWTGQTIQIKEGSTVVASGSTGTSGAYGIQVSGLSVASHTLKAVHSNASSDNMTVTVGKISTTTSLAASSTSISTTDTLTLSGAVTGATSGTVKIYNGSTLVADNVSVSSGSFSKQLTGLSAGTYNYKAVFQADSTHNSSESSVVQVTVTAPTHNYTVTWSADKSVISSGEYVLVTGLIKEDGSPLDYGDVTITIKHGSTTIRTDTTEIAMDGTFGYSYKGTGVGDVTFSVTYNGNLLQETYVIEDLLYYNAEVIKTFSGSSTAYENIVDLGSVLDCEITATINSNNVKGLALIYKKVADATNTYYVRAGTGAGGYSNGAIFKSSSVYDQTSSLLYANTDFNVKIKVSNGKVSIVSGDFSLTDYSVTGIDARYVGLFSWNSSKTITVKNLKVKAL